MAASGSRMYGTSKVVALLEDDDRCEAEFGNLDLEGESEDEFEAVGDFLDDSGSQSLVLDERLSPTSVSVLALAQDNPDPTERDSLLNCDLDCVDGKCYKND